MQGPIASFPILWEHKSREYWLLFIYEQGLVLQGVEDGPHKVSLSISGFRESPKDLALCLVLKFTSSPEIHLEKLENFCWGPQIVSLTPWVGSLGVKRGVPGSNFLNV